MRERAIRKAMRCLEIKNPEAIVFTKDGDDYLTNTAAIVFRVKYAMTDITEDELKQAGERIMSELIFKKFKELVPDCKENPFGPMTGSEIRFVNKDHN